MITSISTGSGSQLPTVVPAEPHHRSHGAHRGAANLAAKIISSGDTDDDGSISKDELTAMLAKTSGSASSTTDLGSKVDALFQQLDTNGDGQVSKSELTAALQRAHSTELAGVTGTPAPSGLDALIGALTPNPPGPTYDASGASTLQDSGSTFSAVA